MTKTSLTGIDDMRRYLNHQAAITIRNAKNYENIAKYFDLITKIWHDICYKFNVLFCHWKNCTKVSL